MSKACFFLSVLCFFLLVQTSLYSQVTSIHGHVKDSSTNIYLEGVSVVLISSKDSFILAHSRTAQNGYFSFLNLLPDTSKYILFISHPVFVSQSITINYPAPKEERLDLADIALISKSKLLEEIVIRSKKIPVLLRKDTLEYVTRNLVLQPNATVEDLLKVLPGLQVDDKGNITVQGRKIHQVLVDGEEFFGDDPTLVTRNLRSDMIDKVQVYDKKTESELLTGIDNDSKNQVINLKLKEDKNNGAFGKAEAGIGTNSYYITQALANIFKPKQKASAYLLRNNIGQSSLGSTESQKLGIMESGNGYGGRGIPESMNAGLHFDKKWNNDKETINSDYKYSSDNVKGETDNYSRMNLPFGFINRNEKINSESNFLAQNIRTSYTLGLGSPSSILISANGEFTTNTSNVENLAISENNQGNYINHWQNKSWQSTKNRGVNLNMQWNKRFKKAGRSFSIFMINNLSDNEGESQLKSITDYYNGKLAADSTQSLNLRKQRNEASGNLYLNTRFTEKLSKLIFVSVSYNVDHTYSNMNNKSFQAVNPSIEPDSRFSTRRSNIKWVHKGLVNLIYAKGKFNASVGGDAGIESFKIEEKLVPVKLNRSFSVWNPAARLSYRISSDKKITVKYTGTTFTPAFRQMLPYAFDNSQLVTTVSNTSLSSSYSNLLSFNYESFKRLSQQQLTIDVSYRAAKNPIALGMDINQSGAYLFQYRNMLGLTNSSFDVTGFYSRPIKKPDIQLTADYAVSIGKEYGYVNKVVTKLDYGLYKLGLLISKNELKKYNIAIGGSVNYNSNKLKGTYETSNNFINLTLGPSLDVFFFKRFQLHSELDFLWQQDAEAFPDPFKRTYWNAWIGASFLKDDQLTIKLTSNDILDQNVGFERVATASSFTESRFETIQRYFLLSASWSFSRFKKLMQ